MTRPEPTFDHALYLLARAHIPKAPEDLAAMGIEESDREILATMIAYMGPGCRGMQRLAARCRCRTQRVQLLMPKAKLLADLIAEHYTANMG